MSFTRTYGSLLQGQDIVSKRLGRPYRGGESRDGLKTEVFEVAQFVVTGFQELGEGRFEARLASRARILGRASCAACW